MAELLEICRAAQAAEQRNEPCWLASVMRVRGSAYRHAGARLLFANGQVLAGSVSGGCLEASLVRKGPWLTREHAVCVRYEAGLEESEQPDAEAPRGSGCDGAVDILIERVHRGRAPDSLTFIESCLAAEQRGALLTVFESNVASVPVGSRLTLTEKGIAMGSIAEPAACAALSWAAAGVLGETQPRSRLVRGDGFQALLEVVSPAPHLFVFGAGPDALPVVELASALGLGVTVCDANPRASVRERFAARAELYLGGLDAVAAKLKAHRTPLGVVMSHHYSSDLNALSVLLDSPAQYIGVLGPERRTRKMFAELFPTQHGPLPARVRAPIGLNLGAETPAQIALSIVSEIQAVLACANAEPLSRYGSRSIHESEPEPIFASERSYLSARKATQ